MSTTSKKNNLLLRQLTITSHFKCVYYIEKSYFSMGLISIAFGVGIKIARITLEILINDINLLKTKNNFVH